MLMILQAQWELTMHGRTYIFTFDSLGGKHPAAANNLSRYLQMEAKDKKGLDISQTTPATGVTALVRCFQLAFTSTNDMLITGSAGPRAAELLRLWSLLDPFRTDVHELPRLVHQEDSGMLCARFTH